MSNSETTLIFHTKLDRRHALRRAIGNLHTTDAQVAAAWSLLPFRITLSGFAPC